MAAPPGFLCGQWPCGPYTRVESALVQEQGTSLEPGAQARHVLPAATAQRIPS